MQQHQVTMEAQTNSLALSRNNHLQSTHPSIPNINHDTNEVEPMMNDIRLVEKELKENLNGFDNHHQVFESDKALATQIYHHQLQYPTQTDLDECDILAIILFHDTKLQIHNDLINSLNYGNERRWMSLDYRLSTALKKIWSHKLNNNINNSNNNNMYYCGISGRHLNFVNNEIKRMEFTQLLFIYT